MPSRPAAARSARSIVTDHERSVPAEARRRDGVHYTPPGVASAVLDAAFVALGRTPDSVCDPTCGGGAFLLSVADRLAAARIDAAEIVRHRLVGQELDGEAVGVARRALSEWAHEHGARVGADEVRIHQGDALAVDPARWPDRPAGGFDLVVGNPPFLSQLSRRTARDAGRRDLVAGRFGAVGAYTDDAGLFLLVGTELVAPGGVVALVQPQSLLSARDADTVRTVLLERSELVGLWAHGGTPFPDADVHVCAPVLRRRGSEGAGGAHQVDVVWQLGTQEHRCRSAVPGPGERWGGLLGPAMGIPVLPSLEGPPLGSVATATAGFRDEFYALRDAIVLGVDPAAPVASCGPRLVTVGMIDPLELRWDLAPHRVGGRSVVAPRVDLAALAAEAPRVGRWVDDRLRPKVLVATQTKVVEAVADPDGSCVPMTPTISVEPILGHLDVWHLVAALSAPPVAAMAVRDHLGAGRSAGALRWSARAVLEAPLPVVATAWDRGAEITRALHRPPAADLGAERGSSAAEADALLEELGRVMTEAHGLAGDHPVVSWWSMRRPRR